jgi:hypothetical protein
MLKRMCSTFSVVTVVIMFPVAALLVAAVAVVVCSVAIWMV